MLELPESYTISKQIEENLKGKTISHIQVLQTPHRFAFFYGDVDRYTEGLEGQRIVGAVYHGGMVEIDTQDWMIALSDGAYPRYYAEKKEFPKKHQLAIYFDDETAIFVSIQMYGILFIFPKGTCEEKYYRSSCEKPDPLTDEFTLEYFRSLYTDDNKKMSAKAFLATQQRIPGLGNGVLQDILWDTGQDPRRNMSELTEEEFAALYHSIRKILGKMCADGGRDTEKDLFRRPGGYISQLSKNALYEPCMKCGHEIRKANYMGGTIYFCEHCQKR